MISRAFACFNFLDIEKGFYYAGTKLVKGRTFTLGTGFENQNVRALTN